MSDRHLCAVEACRLDTLDVICPVHVKDLVRLLRLVATGGIQRVRVHTHYASSIASRLEAEAAPPPAEERCPRTDLFRSMCGHCRPVDSGQSVGPATKALAGRRPFAVQEVDRHPGLWEELQTTIARQAKMGDGQASASKASERPVPYHAIASVAAAQLGNTITTWAREVAESHPNLTLSATTVPDAARWLAALPSLLAQHRAADELYASVKDAVWQAQRVVDRAPDKVFAGVCWTPLTLAGIAEEVANPEAKVERCTADVYATEGRPSRGCWTCGSHGRDRHCPECKTERADVIVCRSCGAWHDAEQRKAWLSAHLAEALVTAGEAAPYLSWSTGKEIKVDTIHKWKRGGRLEACGTKAGQTLYRFSELEPLAKGLKTRASKPRNKEGSAA